MNNQRKWIHQCKYPDAKILIIDDAEEFIKLISLTLKQASYSNILTLTDPILAADAIEFEKPDVILLDYEMPNLTGLDVLKCVSNKTLNLYLPVLILTSNDELDTRLQCLESGAQDFIRKPFDKLDLLLKINNVIHVSMMYKRLESENSQLGNTVRVQYSEISSERKSRQYAEEKLQHRMYHDILTDLPNKILFTKYLLRDIEYAQRNSSHLGILVIVIENLRDINYTLGHDNGDNVIQTIAQRLTVSTRGNDAIYYRNEQGHDFLSRISGNSFAILAPNLDDLAQCSVIAERICNLIEKPILINELQVTPQCHVGIVHYPDHGNDVDTLLKHADIAAYQAKTQAISIEVYSRDNDEFTKEKLALAQALKLAIKTDNLDLHLQPKLSLDSHLVIGFEFLLRWQDSVHGFVPPEKTVATAENTGLISDLTCWVIKRALKIGKRLSDNGYPLSLAINVTASDLLDSYTLQHLKKMIQQFQIEPERITLELTEGTMVQDPVKTMEMIEQYNKLGVKLSIDDFGTGYSSLAYLQKLKVDELKIDRSFIMDLDSNTNNQKIVQSIIDIAHHLNLSVVAEGIENQIIYDLLREYQCDIAQGYHMAKPMPEKKALQYLANHFGNLQHKIKKTS